ncbi:MAG: GNAT family N-acetyltransferase [Candidatus Heimdallarchaeota archaeon]
MWKRRRKVPKGFSKKGQLFLELLLSHPSDYPLHISNYLIWYCVNAPDLIDLIFLKDPFDWIFRYENKYHFSISTTTNLKPLMDQLPWFKTNLVLIFERSDFWPDLVEFFTNFRSLEANEPIDSFNTYNILLLTRKTFNFPVRDNPDIIQLPDHSLPKRYRHLRGGINFGMWKENKIVSFAAAPHILQRSIHGSDYSFALLRGIETQILERRQGYAEMTVKTLCNELFFRYNVKKIFIWVERRNLPAVSMYNKLGFMHVGEVFATYCDLK